MWNTTPTWLPKAYNTATPEWLPIRILTLPNGVFPWTSCIIFSVSFSSLSPSPTVAIHVNKQKRHKNMNFGHIKNLLWASQVCCVSNWGLASPILLQTPHISINSFNHSFIHSFIHSLHPFFKTIHDTIFPRRKLADKTKPWCVSLTFEDCLLGGRGWKLIQ